jgi:hypothetical protein
VADGDSLIMLKLTTPTSVTENGALPENTGIMKAYPNPFNAQSTIEFQLSEYSDVDVSIYNITGQKKQVAAFLFL